MKFPKLEEDCLILMMWPKYLAQIVVAGATAVGRALSRALREEMMAGRQAANRQAGKSGEGTSESTDSTHTRKRTAANLRHSMTLQEAVQILHVSEPLKLDEVQQRFDVLHGSNDKAKGGSFYLQEKIKSAKERLDDELRLRGQVPPESEPSDNAQSSSDKR